MSIALVVDLDDVATGCAIASERSPNRNCLSYELPCIVPGQNGHHHTPFRIPTPVNREDASGKEMLVLLLPPRCEPLACRA